MPKDAFQESRRRAFTVGSGNVPAGIGAFRPAKTFGEFCAPGIARCKVDVTGLPDAKPSIDGKPIAGTMPGYTCQPIGTGYCYYRCDVDASAGSTAKVPLTVSYPGPSGTTKVDPLVVMRGD